MIIVQLRGGLGNQLFQYAAGLSLSKYHRVPVKVDVNDLRHPDEVTGTLRNFELQHLVEPPAIASDNEINAVTNKGVVARYFQKLLPSYQRTIYNEKKFEFDGNFFKSKKDIYLKGYRQSEKYFLRCATEIRSAFQFKPSLIIEVEKFSDQLAKKESVSIHIRRGDYTNTALLDYHGTASQEYYQEAIYKIASSIDNPSFFVFSDNIEWVKQNLTFTHPVQFVSGTLTKNHYDDFFLMSHCKHNIIANSSFSWWAAWLNANPDKIVVAPKKWFNKADLDTKDLIPESWIRL